MTTKICFVVKCKKPINIEIEDYYEFIEFIKGEEKGRSYAHRKCWDDFLEQLTTLTEAKGMLRGLKGSLIKMGLLEPEVVTI